MLALSRLLCLARALKRSLLNRGKEVQASGCPERLSAEFYRWIRRYQVDSRPRLDAAIAGNRNHPHVIEATSRRAVAAFLDETAQPRR